MILKLNVRNKRPMRLLNVRSRDFRNHYDSRRISSLPNPYNEPHPEKYYLFLAQSELFRKQRLFWKKEKSLDVIAGRNEIYQL